MMLNCGKENDHSQAARARHTVIFNERIDQSSAAGIAITGDRLLVSRVEGGLMGYSSMPRQALLDPVAWP